MKTDSLLSGYVRSAIVLVCVLQEILVYFFFINTTYVEAFLSSAIVLYCQTVSLILPTVLVFSVIRLSDRLLWQNISICLVVVLGMTAWVNWNISGIQEISQQKDIINHYLVCLILMMFIALPWLQARIKNKQWKATYSCIYDYFCLNILTWIFSLALVGFFWGIVWLSVELFTLTNIYFSLEVLFPPLFEHIVKGFIFGVGVVTCRIHLQLTKVVRKIIATVIKGFLPLLSALVLLFIIMLPFIGLGRLASSWSAARLLTIIVLVLAIFTSFVYQSGLKSRPYSPGIRLLVNTSLLVLPIYALLALYSIWGRVEQYGWTPNRLWGLLIVLMAVAVACCYAFATFRSNERWLKPLGTINRSLLLSGLVLLILVNTPLLDPYYISANAHMERYSRGLISADDVDLPMLRFNSGRWGNEALLRLQSDPLYISDEPRQLLLAKLVSGKHNQIIFDQNLNGMMQEISAEQIRQKITLADDSIIPDEDWWNMLLNDNSVNANICLRDDYSCVITSLDLNNDGSHEILLCQLPNIQDISCHIFTFIDNRWQNVGYTYFPLSFLTSEQFKQSLLGGDIQVKPKIWSDIEVNGERMPIYYPEQER